jgi:hypothetical protein
MGIMINGAITKAHRKNGIANKVNILTSLFVIILLCCINVNAYAGGYNGSGTYLRYYNWTNDAANGIPITASRFDTEDNGFATGLSNAITRDGQQTIIANIPFNNFRITGLGAPQGINDALNASSLLTNNIIYGSSVSGTNSITFSTTPTITAYEAGQEFIFYAANTNTGSVTINVDGIGAQNVYQQTGSGVAALTAGEIVANQEYIVVYDGVQFELINTTYNYSSTYAPLANPTFTGTLTAPVISATTSISGPTISGTTSLSAPVISATSSVYGSGIIINNTNQISQYSTNTTDAININYTGYNGGTTQYRNFNVYDGKNNLLFGVTGSTGTANFPLSPTAPTPSVADSTTKVATTAFVNPASSISANGYTELPNGLYIQWGTFTTSTGGFSNLTYPHAFPNGIYSFAATINASAQNGGITCVSNLSSASTTVISVECANSSGTAVAESISYILIGH